MREKYFLNDYLNTVDFPFSIKMLMHNGDILTHTHDFTELVIILEGTARHRVNREEYPLKAGDVFVVNGSGAHGYSNACRLALCNIMFDFNRFLDYEPELKKLPGFQSLFILEPCFRSEHKFESKLQLAPPQLNLVRQLLDLLDQEYSAKKNGYQAMVHAYFHTLVAYLSRHYSTGNNRLSDKLLNLAGSIAYLEGNFLEDVTVRQLADLSFLSARQYSRVFKNAYKMTPKGYMIRLRLDYACTLMKNSMLTLSQIAIESGFSDISFFSRLFKQKYGVSPKEYRKNILKQVQSSKAPYQA